ncbi:hypothetical protein [Neisseria montereyensis]|uniref:Uncharacterized protein n=1 Tax=Neisseria montereyensis TaxID=2973938 RepID=A0ABT2FBD3_9NEIS|nr:hypothetical protein [Neisseria montereyensis]MCS4533524.1 hypothetical protein [Neisseria montereyensis]
MCAIGTHALSESQTSRVRGLRHAPHKDFIPQVPIWNNPITLPLYQSSRPSEKQSSDGLEYFGNTNTATIHRPL